MGFYFENSKIYVMAILNVTPDSFFSKSRCFDNETLITKARIFADEGADIFDIGAVSTRPGANPVNEKEELKRLIPAIELLQENFPDIPISIDTYRANVAKECCKRFDISIINDVTGGQDPAMFDIVAQTGVSYVLSHLQGPLEEMQQHTYYNNLIEDIKNFFAQKIKQLHEKGVSSIILDPGFGFSKTLQQNYSLLHQLHSLKEFHLPIMVGISRKSMIYKPLNITPDEALNGTSVLHALALEQGADILRVHDVREARQVITLHNIYNQCSQV